MDQDFLDSAIVVQGSNIHIGEVLPARARQGIADIAEKYFGRLTAASAYFGRDRQSYRCTVNIEIGELRTVTGEAFGSTPYLALNGALRKTGKQLRRMKNALEDGKQHPLVLNSALTAA
jgi:ribosomal subunit interface protein